MVRRGQGRAEGGQDGREGSVQLVRLVFGTFTMFARVIPAQKVCVVFELEDS